jgi:DNA-binding response OmpR family regulator
MYRTPLPLTKASILVLESDPVLCKSLRDLLGDEGYRLVDSAEAEIDLVIAGIGCGRVPAARQAATLRYDGVPLIALVDQAGWLGFEFFDAANALGAVAVLRRPFPRAALLRLIGAVLSQTSDGAAEDAASDDEQASLSELLLQLENPNFA